MIVSATTCLLKALYKFSMMLSLDFCACLQLQSQHLKADTDVINVALKTFINNTNVLT